MAKSSAAKKILATKTVQLPVYLTDAEMLVLGKKLGQLEAEQAAHEQRAKDIRDDLKAKESAISSQKRAVSVIVNQTYEYRPIPVRVEADFQAGKVFEIREDTGEVVGERPVNVGDRQTSILDAIPTADEAERAEVERQADALLQNAGDSELTEKDLKGEPVARKRGRR